MSTGQTLCRGLLRLAVAGGKFRFGGDLQADASVVTWVTNHFAESATGLLEDAQALAGAADGSDGDVAASKTGEGCGHVAVFESPGVRTNELFLGLRPDLVHDETCGLRVK